MKEAHGGRKHSKYSASGAERYFNCQGSVALSEGLPDKSSKWSLEGQRAHEVLEGVLTSAITGKSVLIDRTAPKEMREYALHAASKILGVHRKAPKSDIMVETRIELPFIHTDMFGTFDSAVLDHFRTLHVFDYKYGAGHAVSPIENLQMIFYGLGLAARYDWNFKRVRLWVIQPRIKGYDGPLYWEIGILDLKRYVKVFKQAVARVERFPNRFVEGQWCHWCKAKTICPLKQGQKLEKAKMAFSNQPIKRNK